MGFLFMFVFALLGGFVLPWWWPALVGYALGFWRPRKPGNVWVTGFLGAACAWLAPAAVMDIRNHGLLAGRVAALFHMPAPWWLFVFTALIGGMAGGLGALAGASLRRAWAKAYAPA